MAESGSTPALPSYHLEPVVAGDTPLYSHNFPCASILICRIKNLEELKFSLSTQEQLAWLHDLHVWLDAILTRVPAMKVDLSGDVLQFVSGAENEDADHASTLVALAKELLLLGERFTLPNGQPFQVQMGMHSGECATGVVGSLALKYSVFGPALAVAQQLEAVSAPGLLRASAESRRRATGDERWLAGGSVTLPGFGEVQTFLLGAGAEGSLPAGLRLPGAPAQGARAAGPLLCFRDARAEAAFHRSAEQRLRPLDGAVCSAMLAVTATAIASLAMSNAIVLPAWLPRSSGKQEGAVPAQLLVGTSLAWLAALVCLQLPGPDASSFREPVCMLLRVALSVHRVQGIYLSLAARLPLGGAGGARQPGEWVASGAAGAAAPVLLLSLLLVVRLQKHVLAAAACLVSELAQLAWGARQGRAPQQARALAEHLALYAALACLLPTALLYGWERQRRRRFLASLG